MYKILLQSNLPRPSPKERERRREKEGEEFLNVQNTVTV
jgi:hypothetical protein